MTSSNDGSSEIAWNLTEGKFKTHDPFHEPGLISIIFLAFGRHSITKECLRATASSVSLYKGEVEWIFIENGEDDDNFKLFEEFDASRKVILRQKNYGINQALNQGWALSRGEFCFIHENDWFNSKQNINFLQSCIDIFNGNHGISIIQLRSPVDPNENWGFGKPNYSPWTCSEELLSSAGIKTWKENVGDLKYCVSDMPNGFNNNPCIIRKSLVDKCGPMNEPIVGSDPKYEEGHYQKLVNECNIFTAHAGDIYYHAGGCAANNFIMTGRIL